MKALLKKILNSMFKRTIPVQPEADMFCPAITDSCLGNIIGLGCED